MVSTRHLREDQHGWIERDPRNLYLLDIDGRGERIRTSDPLVPNQVLYQAEPLPDGCCGGPACGGSWY